MSRLSEAFRQRTKHYAADIIRFYVSLPKGHEEIRVVGQQLLRSGTSVAANTREASRARSDAEFVSKMEVVLQEADESQLWLELLDEACALNNSALERLTTETNEIIAILVTIVRKTKQSMKSR